MSAGMDWARPQMPWAWLHAHSWIMLATVRMVDCLSGPTSSNRTGKVSLKTRPSWMSLRECQWGMSRIAGRPAEASYTTERGGSGPRAMADATRAGRAAELRTSLEGATPTSPPRRRSPRAEPAAHARGATAVAPTMLAIVLASRGGTRAVMLARFWRHQPRSGGGRVRSVPALG